MKKTIGSLVAVAIGVLVSSQANAGLIAEWQFNSYPAAGGVLSNFHPDYGTQSSSATANLPAASNVSYSQTTGTTVNQYSSSSPNNALRVTFGTTPGTPVLTLQVSGTGLSGFQLTYASEASTAKNQTWAWSINGTSWTTLKTVTSSSTWGTLTVDFSGVTALNNAATVYFQDTMSVPPPGNTLDFDNIAITAVPEPVAIALPIFGLMFLAATVGRSYLGHLRHTC